MDDRRAKARSRTLKSGKILLGKKAVPCTVRNISEDGACLLVAGTYGLPSEFEFAFNDLPPRPCKVIWLDATTLRVQFRSA